MTGYVKIIRNHIDCTIGKTYEVVDKADVFVRIIDDVNDLNWVNHKCYEFVDKPDESKVVVEDKIINPFIEIKPTINTGTYTFKSSGAVFSIIGRDVDIKISTDNYYDKQSVKELIQILTEIEEVME